MGIFKKKEFCKKCDKKTEIKPSLIEVEKKKFTFMKLILLICTLGAYFPFMMKKKHHYENVCQECGEVTRKYILDTFAAPY